MKNIRFLRFLALASVMAVLVVIQAAWAQRTLYVPSEYPTIAEAVLAAAYGDTVQVAAGTYYENLDLPDGVSLIGAGPGVTTIDGQMNTQVIEISSSMEGVAKIAGFTITNGNGGGISVSGPVLIEDCTFSNNFYGPGIYISGSPIITNCTFFNTPEDAEADGGGGIYVSPMSSPIITNCTFSGNFERFEGNAISIDEYSSVTISNCTFSGNVNGGGDGVGIYIGPESSATVMNSTFSGNVGGDGVIWYAGSTLTNSFITISNCTFSGNQAIAIYLQGGPAFITNCTISGNQGGGMDIEGGPAFITNCTISGNEGFGIAGLNAAITNCIIWGNFPEDLIGSAATYSVVGTGLTEGEGNISADPQFIDPLGGDFRLQPASPCIDAGSNSAPGIPEYDLEGKPRITDGDGDANAVADMGAYEYAPEKTCVSPPLGMISWWPGDGNANDIADENDGILMGSAAFAPGLVGQAFLLDGTDGFVNLGNASSLHVSTGDFTIDAWVNFTSLDGNGGPCYGPGCDMSIVDKMSDILAVNFDGWRLLKQSDNRFWFCLGGIDDNHCWDPAFTVFSQTVATTGVWYHVAAVKNSAGFSIYVNGVLEDSRSPLPNFLDTNSANLLIGSYILEGAHLNGLVDEVQIYNRALSPVEIAAIYNAGSAGKCKVVSVHDTSPAKLWVGLKNSDDQGTRFDVRAALYVNDILVAEGETLCVTGITRNPSNAKEVTVPFGPFSSNELVSGDEISLKVFTRIGTNPDGLKCPGHSNAVGLRLYYDSPTRPSRFGTEISPGAMNDYFLHSVNGTYYLDDMSPTGTVSYKDSTSVNYNNGNPWKEIGTWSMTLL